MNKEEILPCPFCGDDESLCYETNQGTKWGFVKCSCGAQGPDVHTEYDLSENALWHDYADKEWNKRLLPAPGGG